MTPKTLEQEEQVNGVMILDKNENSEKILVIYPTQREFLLGTIGGFLGRFRDGKSNEILYSGKVEHFKGLNNSNEKNETPKDAKKILYAIKQLNGDKENYMSISRYFNAPERKLEEISFDKANELVKNKKAKLKECLGDMNYLLYYNGGVYIRDDLNRAYCGSKQ